MTTVAAHPYRVQRRTVAILSLTQVLGGLGVGAAVAVGGLLAAGLTGSEGAAGLAQTASVVGAALFALPLVAVTDRRGRRIGLGTGLLLAAAGALLVVVGGAQHNLPLLFLGFLLTGSASAAGLQARYAAVDLAEPRHLARDLSTVVWATTVGAVAGPNLADPAGRVALTMGLPELAGGYVLALAVFGAAAILIGVGLHPDPLLTARARSVDAGTPPAPRPALRHSVSIIRASPAATVGLLAIAVSHTAMVSVMVMTPIHMKHVDVSLVVIGFVISVHVLGMYAFSPLVGMAADRLGRRVVLVVGAGLLLVACVVAGTAAADDAVRLGIGLFLLGLGWSCGLVAGSSLLTESVPEGERPGVQGASDLVMNGCGALGGIVAGVVVTVSTYGWLNAIVAVPVVVLAVQALRTSDHRPAVAA